jgi:hypothetical protein
LCESAIECGLASDLDACIEEVEACVDGLAFPDDWRARAYGCMAFYTECHEDCIGFVLSCPGA